MNKNLQIHRSCNCHILIRPYAVSLIFEMAFCLLFTNIKSVLLMKIHWCHTFGYEYISHSIAKGSYLLCFCSRHHATSLSRPKPPFLFFQSHGRWQAPCRRYSRGRAPLAPMPLLSRVSQILFVPLFFWIIILTNFFHPTEPYPMLVPIIMWWGPLESLEILNR